MDGQRPGRAAGAVSGPDHVAERLGLEAESRSWLESLEAAGPPPGGVPLPGGREAAALLGRLGVAEPDAAVILEALPSAEGDPELWWLLERAYHQLASGLGAGQPAWLPSLPREVGAKGRCFWVSVFLAAAGDVRRWHEERGIPEDVTWETLSDLGRHVDRCRRRTGSAGLDSQWWVALAFQGGLFQLGRLQYTPYRLRTGMAGPLFWYDEAEADAIGEGLRPGDPALGVHVPEAGPLTPEACDTSLGAAAEFFARHLPEHASRIATCTSWLLDEQLADVLPATSNIVRFQARFRMVPGAREDDGEILRFVFDRVPASLDDLRPETELERAILGHLRGGGHWRLRTGWLRL
jgi:hypothetical protein